MTSADYHLAFRKWKMCVLIPTYNHGGTVAAVIREMMHYCGDIIVVNDGSTDKTAEELEEFDDQVHLINLPKNRGKGEALRTGFKYAVDQGFDRCMTIDSDGQHYPRDTPKFLDALENYPNALLMGTRTLNHEDVPGASTFGNRFANFWFWVITGRRLKDTQSGFRVYPLMIMKKMRFYSHRYEYESEILIRLSWKDVDIMPVAIDVYYPPGDLRISHFKKVVDFTRITLLNIYMLVLAIFYWHPVMLIRKLKKKRLRELIREEVLTTDHSNLRLTFAVMTGFFFGVAPIWGFQMIALVGVCILFNLNKVLALITAQISLPPMIPFILYFSYKIGGWLLENVLNRSAIEFSTSEGLSLSTIGGSLLQYVLGSIGLGLILALISGVPTFLLLSIFRNPTKRVKD